MEDMYELRIPVRRLRHATDMLRYDGACSITLEGHNEQDMVAKIEMIHYTPGRWASFNVDVSKCHIYHYRVSQSDYNQAASRAQGFTDGLRFFYHWLITYPEDHFLIQE